MLTYSIPKKAFKHNASLIILLLHDNPMRLANMQWNNKMFIKKTNGNAIFSRFP